MANNNEELLEVIEAISDRVAHTAGIGNVEAQRDTLLFAFLDSWIREEEVMIFLVDVGGGVLPVSGEPGRVIFVNQLVIDHFEYTEEEWLEGEIDVGFSHPDDLRIISDHIEAQSSLPYRVRLAKKETAGYKQYDSVALYFDLQGHVMRLSLTYEMQE